MGTELKKRGLSPSLKYWNTNQAKPTFTGLFLKKIAVFVDVQNIYYTTRQAYGRQFNYRKLWQQISEQGEIIAATAYAIHRGDDKQLKFQDALKHIGFTVKLKPYIQRSDGSAKGDWDVGIAIDVLETAKQVDNIILLSGDGDFDLLLDRIRQNYGVITEVYGVPPLTANSLINSTDIFHPITDELLLWTTTVKITPTFSFIKNRQPYQILFNLSLKLIYETSQCVILIPAKCR